MSRIPRVILRYFDLPSCRSFSLYSLSYSRLRFMILQHPPCFSRLRPRLQESTATFFPFLSLLCPCSPLSCFPLLNHFSSAAYLTRKRPRRSNLSKTNLTLLPFHPRAYRGIRVSTNKRKRESTLFSIYDADG